MAVNFLYERLKEKRRKKESLKRYGATGCSCRGCHLGINDFDKALDEECVQYQKYCDYCGHYNVFLFGIAPFPVYKIRKYKICA